MEEKTKTVTIVWWGIGWLASAILLAKQWYKVSLYEKNECLGGRASIMHKDGYTFDMGPSRYLMPDIFEEFFESIDEDIHDYLDLKQLSPSYRIFYEGRDALLARPQDENGYTDIKNWYTKIISLHHLDIYADSQRMSDIFESIEPWAGKQFLTFLDRAKIQYEIGMEFCKKNYDSIFDFFRRDIMWKGIKLNIRTTIDHYVARFFKNQLIRKIMQYTTVFLGTAPKQTPALYNIMSHCDFNMWVRYPKWWLHEIAKALHQIGLKHGVKYHLNTEVIGCEIKDNHIKGLITQETKFEYNKFSIIKLDLSRREEYKMIRLDALKNDPEAFGGNYDEMNSKDDLYRKSRLESKTNTIIFAQDNNWKLIGTANYTIEWNTAKIYGMYCNPEHRWMWIWSSLIHHITNTCKWEWVMKINLRVYTTQNSAVKLYTKEWFTIVSEWVEDNGKHYLEMEHYISNNAIKSDIYLINADMAWFETSILPKTYQTYPKSYRDSKIFAPSGFIIYAGINKKLPNLDHHNLYFCEDRDKNFWQIFDTKELPEDPSIYVSKITHTDPSMAPEWCENLFILVPIPNGIEISDNQKEQYKNMVRGIVEKMAGEDIVWHISSTSSSRAKPGNQKDMAESRDLTLSTWLKSHVVVEEIFTVNDFKSRYNAWKWTALWLAHPIMQTAVFRPNNISKKLDNLFYVWHNTNPGIGVPMVIISAKLALERIMKKFTI